MSVKEGKREAAEAYLRPEEKRGFLCKRGMRGRQDTDNDII